MTTHPHDHPHPPPHPRPHPRTIPAPHARSAMRLLALAASVALAGCRSGASARETRVTGSYAYLSGQLFATIPAERPRVIDAIQRALDADGWRTSVLNLPGRSWAEVLGVRRDEAQGVLIRVDAGPTADAGADAGPAESAARSRPPAAAEPTPDSGSVELVIRLDPAQDESAARRILTLVRAALSDPAPTGSQ